MTWPRKGSRISEKVTWHRIPSVSHFLGDFYRDLVRPLQRVPQPKLMRILQNHYEVYRKNRQLPDKDAAAELARNLRLVLSQSDYDRIPWEEE